MDTTTVNKVAQHALAAAEKVPYWEEHWGWILFGIVLAIFAIYTIPSIIKSQSSIEAQRKGYLKPAPQNSRQQQQPTPVQTQNSSGVANTVRTGTAAAIDKLKTVEEKHWFVRIVRWPIGMAAGALTFWIFWLFGTWIGGYGPAIREATTNSRVSMYDSVPSPKYQLKNKIADYNNAQWIMREQNRHEEKMAREARKMKQVEKMGSSSNKPWYTTSYDDTKRKRPVTDNYGEMEANANDNLRTGSNSGRRNIIPSRLAK